MFKNLFKRLVVVTLVVVASFVFVGCDEEVSFYEGAEFVSMTGYEKMYYYVTHEGLSEKDLDGENKKLSDAINSSKDDFSELWVYSTGSYSIRYASLLDSIVLRVVSESEEKKVSFEIFVTDEVEDYEFSSTILYKKQNIECASTGLVPLDFSKSSSLELETLKGVEAMYETYKKDSHNACAILLLNVNHHISGFGFTIGELGFEAYK